MKTYYIYLVIINHPRGPYFYVGQHGWNGEGIDPDYHGSCQYRIVGDGVKWDKSNCSKWYKDVCLTYGYKIKVLAWCTKDNISKMEERWIDAILTVAGSKLRDEDVTAKPYLLKYRSGTCLNGRVTATEQLHTEASIRKAIETRRKLGSIYTAQQKATEAARSPEARIKSAEGRRASATRVHVWREGSYIGYMNNPEIREFLGATKGQVSTIIHRAKVRGSTVSETWNIEVTMSKQ